MAELSTWDKIQSITGKISTGLEQFGKTQQLTIGGVTVSTGTQTGTPPEARLPAYPSSSSIGSIMQSKNIVWYIAGGVAIFVIILIVVVILSKK